MSKGMLRFFVSKYFYGNIFTKKSFCVRNENGIVKNEIDFYPIERGLIFSVTETIFGSVTNSSICIKYRIFESSKTAQKLDFLCYNTSLGIANYEEVYSMNLKHIDYKLLSRRILLIIVDIVCIYDAGILALLTRFEFSFAQIQEEHWNAFTKMCPFFIVETIIIFFFFRIYSSLWKYAGMDEALNIIGACIVSAMAKTATAAVFQMALPRSWYVIDALYLMILIGGFRFSYRYLRNKKNSIGNPFVRKKQARVMIIGAGERGRTLLQEIQNSDQLNQKVCCFIDDDPQKKGRLIRGVPIAGGRDTIMKNVEKYRIDQINIAMPKLSRQQLRPILDICKETDCELRTVPAMYQIVNGEVSVSKLRPVSIDDLLGRDEVEVDLDSVMGYVSGKVIMVTGGGGSIGSELCRQIASHNPKQLIIFDIYENNAYDIQQELLRKYPDLNLLALIGSVRDVARLESVFEKYHPDIVYHAAAHKHVPLMEVSPNEAIKNNVLGTFNVCTAADKFGVHRFVMISTDKAVNPTNIMGASKRVCEMIIQTFNRRSKTEFVAVRFGNVLGSNGSVIPLFKKQIAEGGPVTVTDPNIIRYFMTIPEAVALVLQAGAYAKGGEIFVLDMGEPVKILDLAKNMIRLSGYKIDRDIKIEFTGLRPGEKLYEELLMDEEGMTDTPNKLIHIGHPIDMDEAALWRAIRVLEMAADDETEDTRTIMASVVPTYHPVDVR